MEVTKIVIPLWGQTKTTTTMFQLVARINDFATFTFSASEHKWLNHKFHEINPYEVAVARHEDVVEGMEMLKEIFGPVQANIDVKLLCLN